MRLYITLGLITICFCTVLALRCYQCKYKNNSSEECRQNLTQCPVQCGSITIYNDDHALASSEKGCTDPALCVTNGMDYKENKTTFNPQCCETELCNNEEAPALLRYSNGLICYSCGGLFNNDCSKLVTCSGDQDKCFTVAGGITGTTTKGCANDFICENNVLSSLAYISGTQMKCCEGILCNNVQRFGLNLILLLVPLLSLLFI